MILYIIMWNQTQVVSHYILFISNVFLNFLQKWFSEKNVNKLKKSIGNPMLWQRLAYE